MSSNYEYWKSPAVKWLLKEFKVEDAESFMRDEATKLLRITGQDSPPFSPLRVATLRGISRIQKTKITSLSQLVPIKGGFQILVNSQIGNAYPSMHVETRKIHQRSTQFTIAHEIGHTYFYDVKSSIPSRPFKDSGSVAEERLCDIFATELLMPAERFNNDATVILKKERNFTKTLLRLSNLYKITLQPIVIRLLELGIHGNSRPVVIKWTRMINPNKPLDSVPKLRVEWAEPASFPYIPRYRSARLRSIFEQAAHSKEIICGTVFIKFGGLNGDYFVEAMALNSGKDTNNTPLNNSLSKSVLSVVWLKGSPEET